MPRNARLMLFIVFFFFLAASIIGGLIWADMRYVQQYPGGKELVPVWKAVQNYATFGASPYEDQTLNDIQFFLHQRPAYDGESLVRVNLPFYTVLFFLPLGMIQDFVIARAVWMLICQLFLLVFVMLGFRLVAPKIPLIYPALFSLTALFWAGGLYEVISGSLYPFSIVLVFAALTALFRGADEAAGAFLALATFCVEPSILLIAFILYWAYTAKRSRVWAGWIMTQIVLNAAAFLLLPSWGLGFARTLYYVFRSNSYFTIFNIFEGWWLGAGSRLAWGWIVLVAILLGYEWYASRRRDQRWMIWTAGLTIASTPLIGLPIKPMEFTLMLLPLMIFAVIVCERWGRIGLALGSGVVIVFFAGTWALIRSGFSITLPISIFMIALLYWVRWWAVRPPRVWIDTITGK